MNFKLKNYISLKTLKSFYTNLYYRLQKIVYSNLNLIELYKHKKINKEWEFTLLPNNSYFLISLIDINNIDNIQKINSVLKFTIPIKLKNLKNNYSLIFNNIHIEYPLLNYKGTLVLNGIKKIFTYKIKRNKGIYFFKYLKENNINYTAVILLNNFNKINIELTHNFELKCTFYVLDTKYNINLIQLFYLLGLSIEDILTYSRYKNSYILKYILLYNFLKLKKYNIKQFNSIFNFFSYNLTLLDSLYTNGTQYKISYNTFIDKTLLIPKFINFNKYKIIPLDFIAVLDLILDLKFKKRVIDTLNHFEFKYIQTLGEYIEQKFKFNLNKIFFELENNFKNILKEYTLIKKNKISLFNYFINRFLNKKIIITLNSFLNITPLVQYLNQINTYSELMHKVKVNYFNFKLNTDVDLREIKLNQLGKLCFLDTTEGINSGLVLAFTKYAKTSQDGNILNYYTKLKPSTTYNFPKFINSIEQETFYINFESLNLRKNYIFNKTTNTAIEKENLKTHTIEKNSILLSPNSLFSFTENLIPFIKHSDPTRGLMGAKMQTQVVPLLKSKKPIIATGNEKESINKISNVLKAYQEGVVTSVTSSTISIRDIFNRDITYNLHKYKKSNQNTLIHQKPIVWPGERIFAGQVLTNTQDIIDSEFSVGNNLCTVYGSFAGYEFEDALIISKKARQQHLFTSLHYNIYEISFINTEKEGSEFSTLNLPKQTEFNKRNLDNLGCIKEGSKVLNEDLLIAKILISNNLLLSYSLTARLIYILFGNEIRNIIDRSLKSNIGGEGRVVKVEMFTNNLKYINQGTFFKCRVFICSQRLLSLGDKLCGKHGNKGVISNIAENSDLPFTVTSITPDIITGPLGVPSRMNLGQLYESLLGVSFLNKNTRYIYDSFFNIKLSTNFSKNIIYKELNSIRTNKAKPWAFNPYIPGKIKLRDGHTGFKLKGTAFLGYSNYSKLIHMVKSKVHYRVVGPYTEILQQPVKGRSKKGGQRFGEMEIWALEAFGASYNLKEILTYKSDDIEGRFNLQEHILNNTPLKLSKSTESFKVLIRELNGLSIDLSAFSVSPELEQNIKLNINF